MDSPTDALESLRELLDKNTLPPVHQWHPQNCREIDMRIARNGDWFYQGSVIQRKRMVKLFSTVLRCDDDGFTYLVTPHEKLKISVEDAPFTAVLLHKEGDGAQQGLVLTTNVGDKVLAGQQHPIVVEYKRPHGEPSPYILVRGNLRALISRSVFIELAQLAEPVATKHHAADIGTSGELSPADSGSDDQSSSVLGLYSDGHFMPLAFQ